MRGVGLAVLLGLVHAPAAWALPEPSANPDRTSFEYLREGLSVPHWGITVGPDGKGTYWEGTPGAGGRDVQVSEATLRTVLGGRSRVDAGGCESRAKRLANMGAKTLSFTEGAEIHTCTFNHSDDEGLMRATAALQAVAETMQAGTRLERKHRFDRLGLDAEMNTLASAVKEGRAAELGNIAAVLRSIASDGEVLERVRVQAAEWLAQ